MSINKQIQQAAFDANPEFDNKELTYDDKKLKFE